MNRFWGVPKSITEFTIDSDLKMLAVGVLGLFLVQGCTTVISTGDQAAAYTPSVEREALEAAASNVAATHWPKPDNISLASRLTGVSTAARNRTTKADAVNSYVASLARRGEPVSILAADAQDHLAAARQLIVTAQMATEAVRPTMSDVATLEKAILDLRQSREIYVAALKKLAGKNQDAQRERMALLRTEFGDVISEIGDIADILADKAHNDRTETFARPTARSNLTGSL